MSFQDQLNAIKMSASPKRGPNERKGMAAWHPYYAGYSSAFVRDVLTALVRSHHDSVLIADPWNGSGTTTTVAQRMGLRGAGVEINPVMVIFAKAKSTRLLQHRPALVERSQQLVNGARDLLRSGVDLFLGDLQDWVPAETLKTLVALRQVILADSVATTGYTREVEGIRHDRITARKCYGARESFFLAALFRVLRKVGAFGSGSNPTWVVKNDLKTVTSTDEVLMLFHNYVLSMLDDLSKSVHQSGQDVPEAEIYEGNSRQLPFPSNSVDVVVTSPPYCTRIDYAVSTKPELLLLGLAEDTEFDALRRSTMGAPVITDKNIVTSPLWGSTCVTTLERVGMHSAKASASYYLPNLLQYFRDAEQSVREILRVLKPGGRAAVVVQSSYYKEIEIPLGRIYVEMVRGLGHHATIARREIVRQHMAHVNTKSSEYKADKVFYEDVVLVSKITLSRRHLAKGRVYRGSGVRQVRQP